MSHISGAKYERLNRRENAAMTGNQPKTILLDVELTDEEAWSLAQFFKRAAFSDFLRNSQDETEAYAMRDAANRVRDALAMAGYSPR